MMKNGVRRLLAFLLAAALAAGPVSAAAAGSPAEGETLRYASASMDLDTWAHRAAGTASLAGETDGDWAGARAEILRAAGNWEAQTSLRGFNIRYEDWEDLFFGLYFEHPELFYLSSSAEVSHGASSGLVYTLYFHFNERYTRADAAAYEAALDQAAGTVTGAMSDAEKAAALHDWLALRCAYDSGHARRDAYAALVDGSAVCQGYALAYMALLQRCGIDCCYVPSDEMNHGWNMVRLGNSWYHVDVTWDDAGTSGYDVPGRVFHRNLFRSDAGISGTGHSGWDALHVCSDTAYDGWFWTDVSSQVVFPGDGTCWYMKGDALVRNTISGTAETVKDLRAAGSRWYVWGSQTDSYQGDHSLLASSDSRLFFTGPETVYVYDRLTGETGQTYAYTGGQGFLYGMVLDGGDLRLSVRQRVGMADIATIRVPVRTALAVTAQPKNASAADGATVRTSVTASGDGLTYQWYIRNPGKTAFSMSSVTKAVYSCKMSAAADGRQVYCVVTDRYGGSVESAVATLTMAGPKITVQPKSVSVAVGAAARTSVTASGDGLTYQWYLKNPGRTAFSESSVTKAAYSCKMSAAADGRQLYCVVTDSSGVSVTSDTVTLTMTGPKITVQPKSVSVADGATARTSVTASGDGLTYQWYIKNPGKTTFSKSSVTKAAYSCRMSAAAAGRQLYCVVTDSSGNSVTSRTVTISMAE